ncbi:hypothetical protein EJB05_43680, partial [Eragrostis curvula]
PSPRANDTTAEGKTRDGHTIRVTFWPAKPPRVSCFTVCCPGLPDHAFGDYPRIVTSEADLVLLRVAICRHGVHQYPENCDFVVYKAGNKKGHRRPSLDLIPGDPDPDPNFTDSDNVLLPCRSRNMYFIAKLGDWALSGDGGKQFDIYVYNSKKRTWSTRLMYASKDFNYHYASKVDPESGSYVWDGWGAETSELDPNKQRLKWKGDCRVELSELTMTDPAYVQMLLNNQQEDSEEDAEAILKRLCAGCPSLSLQHDGVVYISRTNLNSMVKKHGSLLLI